VIDRSRPLSTIVEIHPGGNAMQRVPLMILLLLCCALTAWAGPADRPVNVGPLGELQPTVTPLDAAGVCVMGNTNAAAYAITDWIWGQESYATVFYADPAGCSACNEGFTVEGVTMLMNFRATDVPATFDAYVGFHEAYDGGSGCYVPSATICTSPLYTINITNAGLYAITLPLGACDCAYFGYWYAASITFPNPFPSTMRPDAVTDGTPTGCRSYNDYGTGWEDTYSYGFPGELSMKADIICCSNPVPAEGSTWGSIKSMYR